MVEAGERKLCAHVGRWPEFSPLGSLPLSLLLQPAKVNRLFLCEAQFPSVVLKMGFRQLESMVKE